MTQRKLVQPPWSYIPVVEIVIGLAALYFVPSTWLRVLIGVVMVPVVWKTLLWLGNNKSITYDDGTDPPSASDPP